MAHVVYYGSWANIFSYDIEPLASHLENNIFSVKDSNHQVSQCPAVKEYLKNVFIVKSTYQYDFNWTGSDIASTMYDQKFFNNYIIARNVNTGLLSYTGNTPMFISESDDLNMSLENPYLHDNDISRNLFVIPGKFNIGKHIPRPLELSCKFKKIGSVQINEGDALFYVRFFTQEKIIFKKFIFSENLKSITGKYLENKNYTKGIKPLQWWYDLVSRHNLKKHFLREIKKNLL
jgi:hypothetical protein